MIIERVINRFRVRYGFRSLIKFRVRESQGSLESVTNLALISGMMKAQ